MIERARHSPNGAFKPSSLGWIESIKVEADRAFLEFAGGPSSRLAGRFPAWGSCLLKEIFEPGSYPDLSELAQAAGPDLVVPAELPARIMTPDEHRRAVAIARFSLVTVDHIRSNIDLYNSIAYPEDSIARAKKSDPEWVLMELGTDEPVGLRSGTKYLDCAKHSFRPDVHNNLVRTSMYLNYDIPFGAMVRLHFREDIDMAVEFGQSAQMAFAIDGIAAI